MSAILESHFRIRSQLCRRFRHFVTHYGLPNFIQIGPYSYYFMVIFKMAVATSTSDFGLSDVAVFTKFKVYRQTKFRWNNSIHG